MLDASRTRQMLNMVYRLRGPNTLELMLRGNLRKQVDPLNAGMSKTFYFHVSWSML